MVKSRPFHGRVGSSILPRATIGTLYERDFLNQSHNLVGWPSLVEGACLENRKPRKGFVGSNPTPTAIIVLVRMAVAESTLNTGLSGLNST